MKRLLVGLLISVFVVFGAGVAFASMETPSFVPPEVIVPPVEVIEELFEGVEGVGEVEVVGFEDINEELFEGEGGVDQFLDELKRVEEIFEVFEVFSLVSFRVEEGVSPVAAFGGFVENLKDNLGHNVGVFFWNWNTEKFDSLNVVEGGLQPQTEGASIASDTDSPYLKLENGEYNFLFVEGELPGGSGDSGSSSGCSALTLGALALFLLPAALVFKRKK